MRCDAASNVPCSCSASSKCMHVSSWLVLYSFQWICWVLLLHSVERECTVLTCLDVGTVKRALAAALGAIMQLLIHAWSELRKLISLCRCSSFGGDRSGVAIWGTICIFPLLQIEEICSDLFRIWSMWWWSKAEGSTEAGSRGGREKLSWGHFQLPKCWKLQCTFCSF